LATQTGQLPFATRWWMYQAERFPLGTHFPAIAFFFANAYFAAQALNGEKPLHLGFSGMLAFVNTFLTMLLLRVFDEFKDFEDDRINHPERVVQRGIVTLSELSRLGGAIFAGMVVANVPLGWQAWVAFAAVLGWALLMRVEFFFPVWLKKHVFTYALTHQGITPLIYLYLAVAAVGSVSKIPPTFWYAVVVAVGVGLCYEISRKFRAPEDETPTLDTYTKRFGPSGASIVAFVCLLAACGGGLGLATALKLPGFAVGLLYGALVAGGFAYGKFASKPTAVNAKRVKNVASAAIVLVNLSLVAGMIAALGMTFGGN
jgi:4-hydroxybenzoate polyprenyltransferase